MSESILPTAVSNAKRPQDWTAEEVVEFLSRPLRPLHIREYFSSEIGRANFIDNCVTGAVLLDEKVTRETLRDELNITQFGVNLILYNIITELRAKWPPDAADYLADEDLPPPKQHDTHLVRKEERSEDSRDQSSIHLEPEITVFKFGPLRNCGDEAMLRPQVECSRRLISTPSNLIAREAHSMFSLGDPSDVNPEDAEGELSDSQQLPTPHLSDDDGDDVRASKRPRLDDGNEEVDSILTREASARPARPGKQDADNSATISFSKGDRPDYFIVTDNLPGMGDIPPIQEEAPPLLLLTEHESQLEAETAARSAEPSVPPSENRVIRHSRAKRTRRLNQLKSSTYLSRSTVTASDMALVGSDTDDNGDFITVHKNISPGTSQGVARLMNTFLHKKSIDKATIDGKLHLAYRHHTARHLQRYKRDPITIISVNQVDRGENLKSHIADMSNLDVRKQVYRQRPDRIQFLDINANDGLDRKWIDPWERAESDGFYDALGEKHDLLAKFQTEGMFVPVEYPSRAGSPGLDPQTQREIDQERRSKEQSKARKSAGTPLTEEEMEEIWNEVKAQVVRKWQEKKKPDLERSKYRYWIRAKKQNLRRNMVVRNEIMRLELEGRLENHWDGYLKNKWYSVPQLRNFMKATSRETIENREEAIWWAEAIKGPRPERPSSFSARKSSHLRTVHPRKIEEDAEGEESLADDWSDADDSDDFDGNSDMSGFIVEDNAFDEGHENLREGNDAVLAQLRSRYEEDGLVLQDDEEEESPHQQMAESRQTTESASNHAGEDIELPDAKQLFENEMAPIPKQPRGLNRASSNSPRWFSNEPPEASGGSEASSANTPVVEDRISSSPAPLDPPPVVAESIATVAPATDRIAPDFGDTGPFTIEESTPKTRQPTPPLPIKPEPTEHTLITINDDEVIDLTLDEPPNVNLTKPRPRSSTKRARGTKDALIDLYKDLPNEDIQMQIAVAESRESALRAGIRLSPFSSSAEQSLMVQGPSTAASSSTARAGPKLRPVIFKPSDKKPNGWKKGLQEQYDSKPRNILSLARLVRTEKVAHRASFLSNVLDFYDIAEGKRRDISRLGLTTEATVAYRILAKAYATYSFPSSKGVEYKAKRRRMADPANFSRFIRALTPILREVEEYEASRSGTEASVSSSLSTSSQKGRQTSARPVNLENDNSLQSGSSDVKGKEREKRDLKRYPLAAWLSETESEDDEKSISQRSLRRIESSAEASRSGTSTPRRHKIDRVDKVNQETQKVRQQNTKERNKLKAREKRAIKAGQSGDLINLGHLVKEDPIYFPSDSGHPLYYFQKEGIQFLWKSVVVPQKRTGALLAHTMGMGKTRQVITLLHAIVKAVSSNKAQTISQIPQELRKMRALIVCPPGLISNWSEEISNWTEDDLAPVHLITQALGAQESFEKIKEWVADGTVLIIGYEYFGQLCRGNSSLQKDVDKITEGFSTSNLPSDEARIKEPDADLETSKDIQSLLLDTPTIVIADEAHKIKNKTAKITTLFHQFKTSSRIAMTGSPLANNLTEYYYIMKWVDPEYAGNETEFNNNFKLPIQDGLYNDSLREQILESNKKQRELVALWQPKMHRVNIKQIKDIENTLPPKTEFLLTLPLTPLQNELYSIYAQEAKRDTENGHYKGFFDFVAQLGALLNHPFLFVQAFEERQVEKRQAKKKAKNIATSEAGKAAEITAGDEDVAQEVSDDGDKQVDLESQEAILEADRAVSTQLQTVIKAIQNLKDPVHSYRVQVLLRILDSCIKIREKVLVFSQSVKTLKYIGEVLNARGIKFVRITGDVSTNKRQTITKGFNKNSSDSFVFLISTKAGGLGLNIQAASRIVIFDSQFSPQDEEQAVGRAYRLGQKKHVFVYRFRIGGTFEDVIHNNTLLKMSLAARLVDKTNPARRAKKPEAADWFKPSKDIPRDSAGFEDMRGKDPKVMDGFLEEEWLRELVTQDMYEAHYEELITEEQDGEVAVAAKEPENMDKDEPRPSTPTSSVGGTILSAYGSSKVARTPQGRDDLAQKLLRLRGAEKTAATSPNVENNASAESPGALGTLDQRSTEAPSQPNEITQETDISNGVKMLNDLTKVHEAARQLAPAPLILPSQRDRTPSSQSPRTPTAPSADRHRRRDSTTSDRSPLQHSSTQAVSQSRSGQPVRTWKPSSSKKPYDRPENSSPSHRRSSGSGSGNQESYRAPTHASDSRRAGSPPKDAPPPNPDSERR